MSRNMDQPQIKHQTSTDQPFNHPNRSNNQSITDQPFNHPLRSNNQPIIDGPTISPPKQIKQPTNRSPTNHLTTHSDQPTNQSPTQYYLATVCHPSSTANPQQCRIWGPVFFTFHPSWFVDLCHYLSWIHGRGNWVISRAHGTAETGCPWSDLQAKYGI